MNSSLVTAPGRPRSRTLLLGAGLALALTACAAPAADDPATEAPTTSADDASAVTEEAASTPRLALTYDGGIQILDATTLEVVSDIPLEGFNRLNSAGDGRHVFVSTAGGFQVLDMGAWAEPHGDHNHYYSSDPGLLDVIYEAETPGHVVVHHGHTALFDDGTGTATVLESGEITDADHAVVAEHTTPSPHHGVAIQLEDGTLLVTEGDEDSRSGAVALDAEGTEIAASEECSGIHGEAATDTDHVAFGCQDGVLLFVDGTFTKIPSTDPVGSVGSLFAAPGTEILLGDYATDPEAVGDSAISLIDAEAGTMSVVDLPTEYAYRGLGRDDDGHALVLGADGALHVIDPATGTVENSWPVIDAWEIPEDWQAPRPTLRHLDGTAYITDPASNGLYAVDVETGEIWAETTLDVTPNEVAAVSGDVVEGVSAEHGDEDHDH